MSGRETFVITDCVFIDDTAVAKYIVTFVPNTEDFELEFTLNIPSNAPVGDEFCNYAKTTAAPSDSQASNRKAGPACFIIGGALRVEKVDGNGDPLAGADFDIDCDWPTSTATLADTIINVDGDTEVINSVSGGELPPLGDHRCRWRDQRSSPGRDGMHVHRDQRTRWLRAAR